MTEAATPIFDGLVTAMPGAFAAWEDSGGDLERAIYVGGRPRTVGSIFRMLSCSGRRLPDDLCEDILGIGFHPFSEECDSDLKSQRTYGAASRWILSWFGTQ
jgi:hypothetical protein